MWLRASFVTTCLVLVLAVGAAQATPLDITLQPFPDIYSAFIDVTYTVGGPDNFRASGFAFELDDDGVGPWLAIDSGTFDIIATITGTGAFTDGSLIIGGTQGSNGSPLLAGALTAFGFPNAGGDPLEFLFSVTGGSLAGLYGGLGAITGVILTDTGFGGSFTEAFDNLHSWAAVADTAPDPARIPEPSTILLVLAGASTAYLRKRMTAGKP